MTEGLLKRSKPGERLERRADINNQGLGQNLNYMGLNALVFRE
jgi:hypothetical protein